MADENTTLVNDPSKPIAATEERTANLFGSTPIEMLKSEINHTKDVLIHDREFLTAVEIKNSFYHELIRNCATKLKAAHGADNPAVVPATRMVDLVHKKREGTFVFCCVRDRELKFYKLSREQAIQKLSNDLNLRLRGIDAAVGSKLAHPHEQPEFPFSVPAVSLATKPTPKPKAAPKQRPINLQKNYALQLIAVVNAAAEKDKPMQAALILDRPLKLAPDQFYEETENLRKLRLLLRHRFLAAVRTGTSIRMFTKGLLKGWGVPIESLTGAAGRRRRNSLTPAANEPSTAATTTPAAARSKKAGRTRRNPSDDSPDENCNLGAWTDGEKQMYIEALEQLGWGKWRQITALIPTRCQRQVTSFSRYLGNKVPQVKEGAGGPLPQVLPQAFLHQVFSTKGRRPVLGPDGPCDTYP